MGKVFWFERWQGANGIRLVKRGLGHGVVSYSNAATEAKFNVRRAVSESAVKPATLQNGCAVGSEASHG